MRPANPQRQDGALASCKSGENGAREVVSRNAREAGTAFTKSFDHEDQIDAVNTLPKQVVGIHVEPSVMWAVPSLLGSRSESPASMGDASVVTIEAVAKQAEVGARVAPHIEQTLAQPAAVNEIGAIVNEGTVIEGRADAAIESAAEAHDDIGRRPQSYADLGDAKAAGSNFAHEVEPSAAPQRAALIPEEVIQQAYEIVRRAHTLMATINEERDRAKSKAPSDDTLKDYAGDVKVLQQRASDAQVTKDRPAIHTALAHYAPSSGSFFKMHAAAMHHARSQVTALLSQQDRLQRLAPRSEVWGNAIIELGRGLRHLQDIRSLTRKKALEIAKAHARPRQPKSNVLRLADACWRARYFSETARSEKYRHACFLLAAVGMRPQELMSGVLVQRIGDRVSVRIQGAKVTGHAGQEWRQVFVPVAQFPSWFGVEQLTVSTQFSAPKDPMRSFLRRLSSRVFPPKPGKKELVLSAYVLRHCVATDLWQDGWTVAEIAAVLGERVEETAANYGLRTRGAKWRVTDVRIVRGEVTTAVPVRLRKDNGFLESKRHAKQRGPRHG